MNNNDGKNDCIDPIFESKHTEGLWGYDGEETIASLDWGGYGYSVFPVNESGDCVGWVANVDCEYDAILISSAPELLKALEKCADRNKEIDYPYIENLIKKAKGYGS